MIEQRLMGQETIDKAKIISRKQEIIDKIGLLSVFALGISLTFLIRLIIDNIWIGIYVCSGIIFYFMILIYISKYFLWEMILALSEGGYYHNADNLNQRFEVTFDDGTYLTGNLVDAFRKFYQKILSIKKMD